MANKESVGTVVVAGAANLGVAIAKVIAGTISGSSAMLSEAAHSFADTVTEGLLFTALLHGDQPPDARHPLGYGRAVYVWALLASVATFVCGAAFSVFDGIRTLVRGEQLGNPLASYLVLAFSFLLEGVSLLRGLRQTRGEAERSGVPLVHHLRRTPDTTVKAVVFEDSAALVGLALAAVGLLGAQLTGSNVWDGVASLAIGALLGAVAFELGRSNISMLVGQSLPEGMRLQLVRDLEALDDVEAVLDLAAVMQGPQEVLVAAKVNFRDAATAVQIEARCEQAERRLRARYPQIKRVYLDPTPGSAGPASAGPGSAEPDSAGPGSTEPDSAGAGSAQADSTEPDSAQPGGAGPGSAQADSTEPDSAQPGGAGPGSTEPGTAEPDSAQPGGAGPDSSQPGGAGPGSSQPGGAGPGSAEPGGRRPDDATA